MSEQIQEANPKAVTTTLSIPIGNTIFLVGLRLIEISENSQ